MKKHLRKAFCGVAGILLFLSSKAQCDFISSTSTATDTLSYSFSGGGFASNGCAPIDPTFWLSGNGMSVTITFVSPQDYPSFRVWGMNDDDVASVMVNGSAYPLTSVSASYDTKTICGASPGPDGVLFSGGNVVGANTNSQGNFSFNNVSLNVTGVTTITITGLAGAGWGFAGVTVNCSGLSVPGVSLINFDLFPNPSTGTVYIEGQFPENTFVTITNSSGEYIEKQKLVNNRIDLSVLPKGIYFLSMEINTKTITKRIIKN